MSPLQLFGAPNRNPTVSEGSGFIWTSPCLRAVICFLALLVASCQPQPSKTSQSKSPEIVVAAAANLTDAFAEVGARFTSKTGVRVVFSFGATADLAKQIENGAPFDLFAAADTEHVDSLEQKGLLTPETRALYARGRLVMWLPPGSSLKALRIEDIITKDFDRIAVAKPDVAPYGRATVESLRALGIWSQVEPKVIYAQNVSQAKQYASTGNAEVAFLPLALAPPGSGTYIEVNAALHGPIDQALGIVENSPNQTAARQFVEFLLSDEGQEIMVRKGYRRPISE
ncbi:MAG: molybdate ABC transporter substrate-binding protein [Pyrinomonadaceae bacterium]|nr:molybdate ABC transporter substrate-binding protein [Pyrinomonadaceae bacterium]